MSAAHPNPIEEVAAVKSQRRRRPHSHTDLSDFKSSWTVQKIVDLFRPPIEAKKQKTSLQKTDTNFKQVNEMRRNNGLKTVLKPTTSWAKPTEKRYRPPLLTRLPKTWPNFAAYSAWNKPQAFRTVFDGRCHLKIYSGLTKPVRHCLALPCRTIYTVCSFVALYRRDFVNPLYPPHIAGRDFNLTLSVNGKSGTQGIPILLHGYWEGNTMSKKQPAQTRPNALFLKPRKSQPEQSAQPEVISAAKNKAKPPNTYRRKPTLDPKASPSLRRTSGKHRYAAAGAFDYAHLWRITRAKCQAAGKPVPHADPPASSFSPKAANTKIGNDKLTQCRKRHFGQSLTPTGWLLPWGGQQPVWRKIRTQRQKTDSFAGNARPLQR